VGEQFDPFFSPGTPGPHSRCEQQLRDPPGRLLYQPKLAVQDKTDGAIRRPMGSGKVLNAHLAVFGDGGGDGGD
jgi:hypothetical protein